MNLPTSEMNIRNFLLSTLQGDHVGIAALGRQFSGDDWKRIIDASDRHGISSLMHSNLKDSQASIPEKIRKALHLRYLRTAEQNLRRYHLVSGIIKAASLAAIPLIPLKGIYLAQRIYENIALREMSDVDLLVRPKHLNIFGEILIENGFFPLHTEKEPFLKTGHHLRYSHDQSGLVVEVHWDLMDPEDTITVDIDALWDRSRPMNEELPSIRELSAEDLLLYLSVHLANHTFCMGLRGIYDLAETLKIFGNRIDWDALLALSRRWKASRALYINLRMLNEILAIALPMGTVERLKPEDFKEAYLLEAKELVFSAYEPNNPVFSVWSEQDFRKKTRFMLNIMFPSPETLLLKYPSSKNTPLNLLFQYPVYYRDRIIKYGTVALKLLLGNEEAHAESGTHRKIKGVKQWLLSG
ncbi:MAG: nucleotidyltransferase family protein [Chlorobium limicola]|nr:nucleotidyltransferase family protein [Chlorobium limicola]